MRESKAAIKGMWPLISLGRLYASIIAVLLPAISGRYVCLHKLGFSMPMNEAGCPDASGIGEVEAIPVHVHLSQLLFAAAR